MGASGAGKSTIVDLLLRLYLPTSGRRLVDGVDLLQLGWGAWRDRISVVSQESFVLHDTVRANIACELDAMDEEVEAAAGAAHPHEFIEKMDQGYSTVVGDQG